MPDDRTIEDYVESVKQHLEEVTFATRRIAYAMETFILMSTHKDRRAELSRCSNCGCCIVRATEKTCPICGDFDAGR